MATFNFITVRLGKDSIPDIKLICSSQVGIQNATFTINVKCTQVPENYGQGDYAFVWLGSDNNKGIPTDWKQGFKAVGRVNNVIRGNNYNDTSETAIEIVYIFRESVNRMDILRCAPTAYYWCSSMPLIGLDDHANQTIRKMEGSAFADLRAFFSAIEAVTNYFKYDILQIEPQFKQFFDCLLPNPLFFPNVQNLNDISFVSNFSNSTGSLQQIFYGAPGTGKSHEIKRLTKGKEVIRTTFHPDSDYSTFVGAYKPTSIEVPVRDVTGKIIIENGKQVTENRIVYEFVEQAFLQAYIKAWRAYAIKVDGEQAVEQFLVIEEINRGNCAQIFGDLFQLLDRNNYGFSEYPITADKDMQKQLAKAFNGLAIADAERINSIYEENETDIVSKILSGEKMLLPDNLYIWATMNTSDQSLFPIDSAFKRRWDWKYMPICEGMENGISLGWKIKVSGTLYDWWDFLQIINKEIHDQTKSEDKKLGYFFCKTQDGVIPAETFVGKVVFFLWNDVFKDRAFADNVFLVEDEELSFDKFYDVNADGKAVVKEDIVDQFLQKLGVKIIETERAELTEEDEDIAEANDEKDSKIRLTVKFNDGTIIAGATKFESYVKALEKIGLDKAYIVASKKKYHRLNNPLIDTVEQQEIVNSSTYSYVKIGDYYVLKGMNGKTMRNMLRLLSDELNLQLEISYQ